VKTVFLGNPKPVILEEWEVREARSFNQPGVGEAAISAEARAAPDGGETLQPGASVAVIARQHG